MEFQAVILCGPGHKLHPITTGTCKALLPVGNKPLIEYAVEWCKKAGFSSITVAVNEDDYNDVEAALHASELKVSLFVISKSHQSGFVLKELQEAGALKPQRDIAVIPCDFITEVDPESLISVVRAQDDNTAVTSFYYKNSLETVELKTLEPDVVLHSTPSGHSSSFAQQAEFLLDTYQRKKVQEAKVLKARMAMLWKFPQVVATMDLLSSSIFFISRKVLQYENINFNQPISKVIRDIGRRTWRHRKVCETVVLQRLDEKSNFLRANCLSTYMEANRNFLKLKARQMHQDGGNDRHIKREPGQAMIGNDSLVGNNTLIGEKSSVKRTSIGNNCTIGKKCRLNGCVILDNATIENDVQLENCIIGKGAIIETKAKLTWCYVEGKYSVASETEAKNEILKGLSMGDLTDDEYGDMYESLSDDDESDDESDEDEEFDEDDDEDDLFDRS